MRRAGWAAPRELAPEAIGIIGNQLRRRLSIVAASRLPERRLGACRSAAMGTCRGRCATCAPAINRTARAGRRTITASSSSCSAWPNGRTRRAGRTAAHGDPRRSSKPRIVDMVDKPRAAGDVRAGEGDRRDRSPNRRARFMTYVNTRDVAHSVRRCCRTSSAMGDTRRCRRERSAPPRGPVYLLHGTDDNVIPAVESVAAGGRPEAAWRTRVSTDDAAHHPRRGRPAADRVPRFGTSFGSGPGRRSAIADA